ncbi:MAG: hypothetical protein AAB932_04980, partial [Patescibacteria group bacterium]
SFRPTSSDPAKAGEPRGSGGIPLKNKSDFSTPLRSARNDIKMIGITVPEKIFFQIAKAGFSHPRKQLWSNLAHGLHIDSARVKDALREVAGNEKIRAEDVGFEEWMAIAAMLAERL